MAGNREIKRPKGGKEAAANDARDDETHDADQVLDLVKSARFDPEKLVGSVGDFLLADLRSSHELKSWAKMSQSDQDALIDRAYRQARAIVAGVVEGIASRGLSYAEGLVDDAGGFKDGSFILKVQVPMNAKNCALLAEKTGHVQLVFATAAEFDSAMSMQSLPDQGELIDEAEMGEAEAALEQDVAETDEASAAAGVEQGAGAAPAPAM